MENNFSLSTTRLYDNSSNINKNKAKILENINSSNDELINDDNCKKISKNTEKYFNEINFDTIIMNVDQLIEFCLKHNISKINILFFLVAYTFKQQLEFIYNKENEQYCCTIKVDLKKSTSNNWSNKSDAKNDAIELFLLKYFPVEKQKIDEVYKKHHKLVYKYLSSELRVKLLKYLYKSRPNDKVKITKKVLIQKKKSEEIFNNIFYENSKNAIKFLGEKRIREESKNSDLSDKLKSSDPELINYLDLYNITPYKIFSSFRKDYEKVISIKEEVLQINLNQNNIKILITLPEFNFSVEATSKNKKVSQELAAQKFIQDLVKF